MKRLLTTAIFVFFAFSVVITTSCAADEDMLAYIGEDRVFDPFDEVPELMRRWIEDNRALPAYAEHSPVIINIIETDLDITEVTPFEHGFSWFNADGLWGLVDGSGQIIISPQLDGYIWYAPNLAFVSIDSNWGIVDISGEFINVSTIIPLEYEGIYGFAEGLATVRRDGKVGFVNTNNEFVIPPQYDNAGTFIGGIAWVELDGRFGAINKNNEIVVSIRYSEVAARNAETIIMRDGGRYIVFDTEGFWAAPNDFDHAEITDCGLIIVRLDGLSGVIDARGNTVLPIIYENIFGIHHNLAIIATPDGNETLINLNGSFALPSFYHNVSYADGLFYTHDHGIMGVFDIYGNPVIHARFGLIMEFSPGENVTWFMRSWEENRWGIIDRAGNIIMEPRHYDVEPFSEGLAMVRFGDAWGFVNERGQGVIGDDFERVTGVGGFRRGVALVARDGLFGFVDTVGNFLAEAEFDEAFEFGQNAYTWAKRDGAWYLLRLVIPELVLVYDGARFATDLVFDFNAATPFTYGFSIIYADSGVGVVDSDGRILIRPVYDMIEYDGEKFAVRHFLVRRDGKYGYISRAVGVILDTVYDSILRVRGGFIASLDGKFGFVSAADWDITVPFEYDEITEVSENLLAARAGNRFALIGTDGSVITDFIYDFIGESEYGMVIVGRNGRYGFISESGEVLIPLLYDFAVIANDSHIIVREGMGMGVVDFAGNTVIPPDYAHVEFFGDTSIILANEDGHFIVTDNRARTVHIDSDQITILSGRAAIARKGHRFGIINNHGDILIPIGLDNVADFPQGDREQTGLLTQFDGRFGLVNMYGETILLPVYDFVMSLSDDLIAVAKGGMFGLVNARGEEIFMQELTDTWTFNEGLGLWLRYTDNLEAAGQHGEIILDALAFVYDMAAGNGETMYIASLNGRYGIIGLDGEVLLPITHDENRAFDEALSMWLSYYRGFHITGRHGETILRPMEFLADVFFGSGGIHQVARDGKVGYINAKGEIVVPIIFDEIAFSEEEPFAAVARIGGLFGFIGHDGTPLTPIIYESVTEFRDNAAWVRKDGSWGILVSEHY